MNLLGTFWDNEVSSCFSSLIRGGLEDFLVADQSEFVYVDGEEGDYGTVRYFDKLGRLVATSVHYGGDDVVTEFTNFGIILLSSRIVEALEKSLPGLGEQ